MNHLLFIAAIACFGDPGTPEPPSLGLSTECVITEVYDGDTVVVEITSQVRVRLLDCNSPEIRTRDKKEKRQGLESRDHLAKWLGMKWDKVARRWRGRVPATLHVPFAGANDLGDVTTLGRVLGSIWAEGDQQSLSAVQVLAGHATPTKADK